MTSAPFLITPGPASQLTFTAQPPTSVAGTVITPPIRVTATDRFGNIARSFIGPVTIALGANPGNGTLSGTTSVAAVSGVATFGDLRISSSGSGYTLTAAASGLTSGTSAGFNVNNFGLAFLVQPSNAAAGATIAPPVQVSARDAQGNTDTSFTGIVTLGIGTNPGGGTLSGTVTRAAVAGVATFSDLAMDKAGAGYTLTAASPGLISVTSAPFDITP